MRTSCPGIIQSGEQVKKWRKLFGSSLSHHPSSFFIFFTPLPLPPTTITRPFIHSIPGDRLALMIPTRRQQLQSPLLFALFRSFFFFFPFRSFSFFITATLHWLPSPASPPLPTTTTTTTLLPPSNTQTSRVASHNFEWFPFCRWLSAGQCLLLLGMTGGVYTGDQPARRRAKLPH